MDTRYKSERSAQNAATARDPEIESPSRIRDGISGVEERLSEVHSLISLLEKRFDTVLQPTPPQPAASGHPPSPEGICSHVRGRLELLNEGFSQAADRLRDITRRAEV